MDVLKQLHISVSESFEQSFDNAYRDFNAQLALRDTQLKEANRRANIAEEARDNSNAEIVILQDEISHLQKELRQTDEDLEASKFTEDTSRQLKEAYDPELVLSDLDRPSVGAEGVKTISTKYAELYEQVMTLAQASGELRTQVKRHKRKLERLQTFLRGQEFSLMVGGIPVTFQRVQRGAARDQEEPLLVGPTLQANSTQSQASGLGRNSSLGNVEDKPQTGDDYQIHAGNSESALACSNYPPSSEETRPASALVKTSATNNGTLKRKRPAFQDSLPRTLPPPRSPTVREPYRPIIIKSETMSSSPLLASSSPGEIAGTQDLDEIGNVVQTPTKKNNFNVARDFPPRDLPAPIGSSSRKRAEPQNPTFDQSGRLAKWPRVLQPVDGNLRTTNGFSQVSSTKGKKNSSNSSSRIAALAEDGDENSIPRSRREKTILSPKQKPKMRNPSSEDRLAKLLDAAAPVHRFIGDASTIEHSPKKSRSRPENDAPLTSPSSTPAMTPEITTVLESSHKDTLHAQQESANTQLHQTQDSGQLEVLPDDEPYRARPVHRLGLGHFKLNPDYNQGLDYAFSEVVRKKDQRKCIEGCTRPGCCGDKFRAMARFGFLVNPSNPQQQEEEDQQLLEDYLGDDKRLLDTLSPEKRQELLGEARARSFANRFGRHRHQHQRPGTPPGFWRTDMPGTQELEKDREEARQFEREKVKERYREAMRQGGCWKFADE